MAHHRYSCERSDRQCNVAPPPQKKYRAISTPQVQWYTCVVGKAAIAGNISILVLVMWSVCVIWRYFDCAWRSRKISTPPTPSGTAEHSYTVILASVYAYNFPNIFLTTLSRQYFGRNTRTILWSIRKTGSGEQNSAKTGRIHLRETWTCDLQDRISQIRCSFSPVKIRDELRL